MFHFHKWSKWVRVAESDVLRRGRLVGYAFVQSRQCSVCGFTQYDKQEISA